MRFIRYSLALTCLVLVGCGDDGPKLVPVNGKVTLDGKAVPFKSVQFVPEAGTPGTGAGGNTDKEGNYRLLAVRGGSTQDMYGVPAGKYRVIVVEPTIPIEEPIPEATGDEPVIAIGIPTAKPRNRLSIPASYSNPASTPFVIDVPSEGGTINLQMKK